MERFCRPGRAALLVAISCAAWSANAGAQSASFEPEPSYFPRPPGKPADHPVEETSVSAGKRRADHLSYGALVGVGFPRPLAAEGIVRIERAVMLGVEYSALPQISISNVKASCWAIAGDARVFPFRGPFFLGLRVGEQHATAEASLSAYGYTVPASLSVDTVFLDPRLGFLWTWDPGIALGIAAGVQIPLSSNASSELGATPSAVATGAASARQSLENVASSIGQTTLPTVDLLRVGVLF